LELRRIWLPSLHLKVVHGLESFNQLSFEFDISVRSKTTMTQENFLLKAANPEMQERGFREFLEAQRELQEIWPWQASVDRWVDHILSFAEKPYLGSVFLDPQPQRGGNLHFRVDGLVLPGPRFTAEQYGQLLSAIQARMQFSQSMGNQSLQEGFILMESGQRHWVGMLQTVFGVQVTVCFELIAKSAELLNGWPERAKNDVAKMQQHPNGLIVCCHRGWSLSRQDAIFDVLNSIISEWKQDIRIGVIAEGLQTPSFHENITQLCVDGSQQSWAQACRVLVAQDIDVVLMRGRNEAEILTQAVLTAREDRMVLVDVSHVSVLETLLWLLTELPVSAAQTASVLLGVVGSYPAVRRVCPHCVVERSPDDSLFASLQKQGIALTPQETWVQGQGCLECNGGGYALDSRLTVTESIYIDSALAKLCASGPNEDQLSAALAERGFRTYFEQGVELAQQGLTTLNEAVRVGLARRSEL
jgi:type II secretory ATPase GspE/PulE/Tfp pilus assembly ATPase PilB-like protein